jgi:hypothetical protein
MFSFPPMRQDVVLPGYHNFADRSAWLGVPNFLDVASNLPFLAIGALGMARARRVAERWERRAWNALFAGVALTALGSAYYHWAPDNARLVWDRLPMTICFMSLFAIVIAERIGPRRLASLIAIGAASVLYWRWVDDLRFYALVQYFPMLGIPMVLLLFPPRYIRAADLLIAGGFYGLAKIFELLDAEVFALGGFISGHTLKHLAAGAATWWILRVLSSRQLAASAAVPGSSSG